MLQPDHRGQPEEKEPLLLLPLRHQRNVRSVDRIGPYYLWSELPGFNDRAQHFFNLLSASFRLLAIVSFLDMANQAPRWNFATVCIFSLPGATFVANNLWGVTKIPPLSRHLCLGCGYPIWLRGMHSCNSFTN